jgi:hypothetical protein
MAPLHVFCLLLPNFLAGDPGAVAAGTDASNGEETSSLENVTGDAEEDGMVEVPQLEYLPLLQKAELVVTASMDGGRFRAVLSANAERFAVVS